MTQTYPHPANGPEPVCPRHPDRVAYVRCQRCDQPVCPACQVPSAVGVHCVDCVRLAQASRPSQRNVVGAVTRSGTLLTPGIIAACAVVYLAQLAFARLDIEFGLWPVVAMEQPWRFLTTAFLHGSALHLAVNMWALWVCGSSLEPLLGRARFAALYVLSALGGSVAVYLDAALSGEWNTLTVGASGAVFGLFAAIFVIQHRLGRDTTQIIMLLVLNLAISVLGAGISWQGHLGGMVVGGLVAAVYAWAPRRHRTAVTVGGCLALSVVLVALTLIAATTAPGVHTL